MRSPERTTKIRLQKTGRVFPAATMLLLLLLFLLLPSWALAAPPQVICVPQVPSDLLVPHDTWSGESTILKGVAKDSDNDLVDGTYYWEYGDGGESAPAAITNPDNLAVTHTYTAAPGTLFVARLHVTDAGGESSSDDYRLIIRNESLDIEINKSIDDGLWWLYTHKETLAANQFRWNNVRHGNYYANSTASAVQAYEINGHLETGDPDEDPYVNVVRGGIDYLMTRLITYTMTSQAGGHPEDYNNDGDGTNDGGNGIGLSVSGNRPIYELGAVMDALVASGTQDALARTGGTNVLGRRYQDIVQDMVDMYAWGMDDAGGNRGGWRYNWNSSADNSASQWGAIGMLAAESHFGCTVPGWVKTWNNYWLNASYNSAGFFGYTGTSAHRSGYATGPSGMVQLSFCDREVSDPRWQACQDYIDNRWNDFIRSNRDCRYYSYYAFAKAMRLALPEEVTHLSSGLDWYGDETVGLARILVDRQNADGSWPYDGWPYVGERTAAAWNVIILTRTLFEKPPVAIIHAQPNPGAVGQIIHFDASDSYHVDPAKEIVEYLWDFDASDGVDFVHPDATGPMVDHAYGDLGDYTASLKVIDNSTPSRFDIGTSTIQITIPPHPPTADIGGPYLATVGEAVQVDGSGSYDIDENLGDSIVTWEWEADFVAPYDFGEASGQIATLPAFTAAGRQDIGLRVTDNTAIAFPTAGSADLTDVDYGEVIVYEAGVTDLYARPKGTKCQLVWTHIDAPLYEVLRSESGPNNGFELIGTTASTYSTYIDYNVVMSKDYWYRIRSEIGGETMLSGPVHIYSVGRIRNRPPVITSTPIVNGQEQALYEYDVQADDPEGTRLTYLLDMAPAGMVINAATGLISWTPTLDQVGLNDVMVRVNDSRRASASQFFQIVVDPRSNTAPETDAGGPYSGLVTESLTFTGSAVDPEGDPIVEYRWIFGDGSEAYGQVVTHAYAAESSYVVTLYATDDRGATGHAETRCQTGLANRPPIADAGGPYVGEVDQPVEVDGSQSDDPDGDLLTYTWNYNTATGPLVGKQVTFTFDTVGTYEVTLTVEDGRGGSDTSTAEIVVTPPNEPPVSAFTYDLFLWNNLTFDGTGSHDPEGRPLTSWEWDFGDGVITTGAMASHLYNAAGDYTVRLTVTDEKGATDVSEQLISIIHPPNNDPDIEAGGPYTGPLNTAITLTATGADPDGDPITFTWTYDGNDTIGETLELTFTATGTYDVLLSADDGFGGVTTDTAQVVVFDPAASAGDETPPVTSISSPASGSLLNGMVTFTGSVNDDNLVFWVLEYAPSGTEQWQEIATGSSNVDNDFLGEFDAGLLQDDLYRFRLRAEDQNYSVNTWIQCEVSSPLKLGQFSLEYVDLQMPLAGIPIKVIRRYDTRDAADPGDFGYGWKLGAVDPEIRETVPTQPMEETLGFFVAKPYQVGTRVYLTDPDGKRIGFTFEPTPAPSLLGTVYIPKFRPDPGVHDRLEADPIALTLRGDGSYVFFLIGLNYNPADFRLVRKDGTTYHYNQFNGLRKIADRNDNELVYTYDGIFHSSGESVQFHRNAEGRIVEVVDPNDNVISYAYDLDGNLAAVTDQENLSSSYSYYPDPAHYLNTITDSLGHQAARYEYDANGRLMAFTNALGDRFEQAYNPAAFSGTFTDANGNVTQLFYDAQGNLIREVDPLGGETAFTYDADKNKTSETDANGNTTLFTYDDRGNMLTKTDALGNITTFTYNAFNKLVSATDPLGRTTTAVYDSQGNMTQFTNPAGNTATLIYDAYGRIEEVIDFNGNRTAYEYTAGVALPTRIINPDGTHKDYAYLWNGQILSISDETGGVQSKSYDRDGRLVAETDALGNETRYEYAGHLIIKKTCPLGHVTTYNYDDANRIISQTDHLGGVSTFTYDANGNRLSVTDPAGNTTRFVYDALNRLVMKIDPLNMRTTFTYDLAGNLVEQVDRNNRRRTFVYNALNQRVRETWLDGVSTVNVIDFGFDAVGNQKYVADQNSSLIFAYDAVNNLISADNAGTPGVPALQLSYSYDPLGNRISVEDNLGARVESVYGSRKQLLSRTWQGSGVFEPVRVECAYDARGNRLSMSRYDDVSGLHQVGLSNFVHDSLNRLTGLKHDAINGGITTVADYSYTYNAAGLLLSEAHHSQTFSYTYDAAGQLTESARSLFGNETFSYDANGNRNSAGYVVGAANRIISNGEYDYGYDAEGNLVNMTETATGMVTIFTYDHRNRLTSVEKRDAGGAIVSSSSYKYDGLDRRIRATVNGQTTFTVYDNDHAWADFDELSNIQARYLFDDGPDALLARSLTAGGTDWYLADKLGTVRDLVDVGGSLLNHVDYDSFGGVRAQTDTGQGDRFLFAGREYEAESGLYFNRARYYDPGLGRFISEDPTGFDGGDLNLYRYVNNSPLNGTDPTGEQAIIEFAMDICSLASIQSFGVAVNDLNIALYSAIIDALKTGHYSFEIHPVDILVGLIIPCGIPSPISTPGISGGS